MDLQTFKAGTMAEALSQVKTVMGAEAVILHTRTYQQRFWLGIRRKEVVEVTAGRGLRVQDRGSRRPANATGPAAYARPAAELSSRSTSLSRTPANAPARQIAPANVIEGSRRLLETPAANSAFMLNLTNEMTAVKGMVKELMTQARHKDSPEVPEKLFDQYMQLIQNQVAEEVALDVIKIISQSVRPEHLSQGEFIREKLAEQLEKMLPVAGPIRRTKLVGPHVVALIGPTGVGKTTTIAKLAANLKLREKQRVGLITLDTYRIAAVDQLKKYADILGAPLRVVGTPEDLREAIRSMSDCEYILIDTAGRSPNDAMKLGELKNFIAVAEPDEVHLVISTTASQACVELAVERFSNVRVDKIIFTKLDEAAHVGVVMNVIRKVNKSLSYITTGQNVPEDIEVGRGRRLAELILGSNL